MKIEANSIEEYYTKVPEKRVGALQKLRALCLEYLPGYDENLKYNMPSYSKNGVVEVAFASQKQHLCVYILKHDVMLANKPLLEGLNVGKGCIRYSNPDKIDYDLIQKLLEETVKSNNTIC